MSSLPCVRRFFSEMKLVKTTLRTQLKQTNLENRLHILTENLNDGLKEGFNDTAFQYSVDELKTVTWTCEWAYN